jgi:hypothetical protein
LGANRQLPAWHFADGFQAHSLETLQLDAHFFLLNDQKMLSWWPWALSTSEVCMK